MRELGPNSTFAGHRVLGLVGRGGMGMVYRAIDVSLDREVALKVIAGEFSADQDFRERFKRESRAAAAVHHPNVIPIYQANEQEGMLYVTMRYVEGTDLGALLLSEGRLEARLAVSIASQVAAALAAAHARGIVHRDVKPSNVLIEREGQKLHAYLTDFGLAKLQGTQAALTRTGMIVGTLNYIAPEQLNGQTVDARTDVYALGCVLYHALTGQVPYPKDSDAARMFAHLAAPIPSVLEAAPETPLLLDDVIRCAMAKEPGDRYPTAADLAQAALGAVESAPVAQRQTSSAGELSVASSRASTTVTGAQASVPLPRALKRGTDESPFAGREHALQQLQGRYRLVEAGKRQFVVLSGEPGIGKTRLASEFAYQAYAAGATVLYGRCDEESLVPYQPFIASLQHYIGHCNSLALDEDFELELAELARLIPELRRHIPRLRQFLSDTSETNRFRLFEAVTKLLSVIALTQPLVLILDDLQWADRATTLLLRHVVEEVSTPRLMLLGAYRDIVTSTGAHILELVDRQRHRSDFAHVSLGGLDQAATKALVVGRDDRSTTADFFVHLQVETDGNPFFIEETLRSLAEIDTTDDAGVLSTHTLARLGVPEGVKGMIGQRLSRLSHTTMYVLKVACVIGREFDLAVLETVVQAPGEQPISLLELISALEEAIAARLVREVESDVDRFTFSHALVRETLYEQQSASRRVRLHHRVGQALEASQASPAPNPAELAHHFFEARGIAGGEKAIEYSIKAARQANDALAYEQAVNHYARALETLDASRTDADLERCAILLDLGDAEWRAGQESARTRFQSAAEIARRCHAPELLARAALGFGGRFYEAGVVDQPLIGLLREALQVTGAGDGVLRARLLASLADILHFTDPTQAAAVSGDALRLARRIEDPDVLLAALVARHTALLDVDHLDERLLLAEELISRARAAGRLELLAQGHHWRLYDLFELGDLQAAESEHRRLSQIAEELRQPLYRHLAAVWGSTRAAMSGRFEEAERLARQAYAEAKRAQVRDAESTFVGHLFAIRRYQGRLPELRQMIERVSGDYPSLQLWQIMRIHVDLASGDMIQSRAEFEQTSRGGFAAIRADVYRLSSLALLAEVCAALKDAEQAAVLYRLLRPYGARIAQTGSMFCLGSVERYLGVLSGVMRDRNSAAIHFKAALERQSAMGAWALVAHTESDQAYGSLALHSKTNTPQ